MPSALSAKQLGIDSELLSLVDSLAVGAVSEESALIQQFSRVAWNHLTEPGDSIAGVLLADYSPAQALALLLRVNSASDFLAALPKQVVDAVTLHFGDAEGSLRDAIERWLPRRQLAPVINNLRVMQKLGGHLVTPDSGDWPAGLNDLGVAAPILMWLRGDPARLNWLEHAVALVGSRDSTLYGRDVVVDLSADLASAGVAVVSGGAFGIDALAHQASLALQGKTVAVMAGGLESLYPAANRDLLLQVISEGLVVAEVAPGVTPSKWRFLQRNRLIAAMSKATIVIEAGYRSGSINTANHATQLARPVGAIPGRINSMQSAGCHRLIRSGQAELISNSSNVLELIGAPTGRAPASEREMGPLEVRAFDAIGFGIVSVREIRQQAGLTESEVKIALSALELFGDVQRVGAKWARSQTTL